MMSGLIRWFLKTFAPYAVGIGIGVGFFFLLLRVIPGPVGEAGSMAEALTTAKRLVVETPATAPTEEVPPPVVEQTIEPVVTAVAPEPPAPVEAPPEPETVQPPSKPEVAERSVEGSAGGSPAHTEKPGRSIWADQRMMASRTPPEPEVAVAPEKKGCGQRPAYPGAEMNRHMACMWRQNCLDRLAHSRRMIEQGRERCPTSGVNARACQNYHDSMALRYHPGLCEQGGLIPRAPGW